MQQNRAEWPIPYSWVFDKISVNESAYDPIPIDEGRRAFTQARIERQYENSLATYDSAKWRTLIYVSADTKFKAAPELGRRDKALYVALYITPIFMIISALIVGWLVIVRIENKMFGDALSLAAAIPVFLCIAAVAHVVVRYARRKWHRT